MELKNAELWSEIKEKNTDFYSSGVVRYCEAWADLMEKRMADPAFAAIDLPDVMKSIANDTSHEADTEGITGFMYGMAVDILSRVWVHGEALRRWHNVDIQLGNEGERANEEGGTLNPALLSPTDNNN